MFARIPSHLLHHGSSETFCNKHKGFLRFLSKPESPNQNINDQNTNLPIQNCLLFRTPLQTSTFGCKIPSRWSKHFIAMEQSFHRDEIFELNARVGKIIATTRAMNSSRFKVQGSKFKVSTASVILNQQKPRRGFRYDNPGLTLSSDVATDLRSSSFAPQQLKQASLHSVCRQFGIVKAIFASALTAPSVATEEHTRGYVTCLACTLEECPLVSYVFDSGLLFREQVCGACIRGYAARPPVIIEMSPSGNKDLWLIRYLE